MGNVIVERMKEELNLLRILAEGCRIHPAYRAKRKATMRCAECVIVWNARTKLNEMKDNQTNE